MSGRYDDMLDLPRPTSKKYPRMSIQERAAQFSPFAALTGHYAVLQEAARQTEDQKSLDEYEQDVISRRLTFLQAHMEERPEVRLCYFQADERKEGGAYIRCEGRAKKLDLDARLLCLEDGRRVPLEDILELMCALTEEPT